MDPVLAYGASTDWVLPGFSLGFLVNPFSKSSQKFRLSLTQTGPIIRCRGYGKIVERGWKPAILCSHISLDRHKLLSMAKKTVKAEEALKARCVYPWDSTSRKRTLAPVYWGSGPPGTACDCRVNPLG